MDLSFRTCVQLEDCRSLPGMIRCKDVSGREKQSIDPYFGDLRESSRC